MIELDEPFRPLPGEVYWIDTRIAYRADIKPSRPAVVLAVPRGAFVRYPVVTRTTKLHVPGVPHAASPALGMVVAGVWAHLTSVEASSWTAGAVRRAGLLEPEIFAAVQERFG
jgi:mRNA-degrading endonuclease toxin of MazEF toxin-antitoxin module